MLTTCIISHKDPNERRWEEWRVGKRFDKVWQWWKQTSLFALGVLRWRIAGCLHVERCADRDYRARFQRAVLAIQLPVPCLLLSAISLASCWHQNRLRRFGSVDSHSGVGIWQERTDWAMLLPGHHIKPNTVFLKEPQALWAHSPRAMKSAHGIGFKYSNDPLSLGTNSADIDFYHTF